jgi:hypothetical protein
MTALRKKSLLALATALGVGALMAPAVAAEAPDCNWGLLTADAIAGGFDQGGHSSTQVNPRVGLANVVNQGDMDATCTLIKDALGG